MMRRKTILVVSIMMMVAALLIFGGCADNEEETSKYLAAGGSVTGSDSSEIRTNLRWKNVEGATGYVIYRSSPVKSEKSAASGKLKMTRLDRLSKRTNEYKDEDVKYKKWYCYKIVVNKKAGGKKSSDSQELIVYTGIAQCQWEEDLELNGYTSPERIDLSFRTVISLRPQGYVVSRKTSGGSFRNVASLKGGYSKKWKDTEVSAGKTYTYRVRAFRKMGSKRLYGVYSKELRRSAVWREGRFELKAAWTGAEDSKATDDKFIIMIESDEGNAETKITDKNWYAFGLSSQEDNSLKFECAKAGTKRGKGSQGLVPSGTRFRTMKNGLVLKGGESGYIRISGKENDSSLLAADDMKTISFFEIRYNGLISELDLDLDKMKGKAFVMSEYYQK